MKNIEKYYYAITDNLKSKSGENIGCSVFDIRHGNDDCGDTDCLECCLKNLEWLNSEYRQQILTDEEKEIVRVMLDFIHKFGCTVIDVRKIYIGNCYSFIAIRYENHVNGTDDTMSSPIIDNDKFKGMELYRKYTLEELGITCPTQKDN